MIRRYALLWGNVAEHCFLLVIVAAHSLVSCAPAKPARCSECKSHTKVEQRPRVMRSCSQGQRRSVDRGTCGPGIQPRKKLTPGRRRCRRKRKATSGAPISRGVPESRAAKDPVHVRRRLAREPGDPRTSQGCSGLGTHREV